MLLLREEPRIKWLGSQDKSTRSKMKNPNYNSCEEYEQTQEVGEMTQLIWDAWD